jgi:Phytanoyl-CoA dioxygenase (PhyH)
MHHDVERHGFSIAPEVISQTDVRKLRVGLGEVPGPGRRGLLASPVVAELARSPRFLGLASPHFPDRPFPVRAIYFDKSAGANWLVAWHQDLTIALQARAEVPGFGPWSNKDGVTHVQPPVELLQQMLTIRLHLDDANESNGALRVLPGTHRYGRVTARRIAELRANHDEFVCKASAGDAMLMRPLLLHASGRSRSANHRRILHIEYASFALPPGLAWHEKP